MRTITDYMTQKMSVNESIRGKDFETARAIMIEYFKKYGIYSMPSIEGVTVKGTKSFGNLLFNVKTNLAAYVLWGEDSNGALTMLLVWSIHQTTTTNFRQSTVPLA